jgi:hypothetical protein
MPAFAGMTTIERLGSHKVTVRQRDIKKAPNPLESLSWSQTCSAVAGDVLGKWRNVGCDGKVIASL